MADTADTNPRGIPKAPFVDDVEEYMKKSSGVEATLRKFAEAARQLIELNIAVYYDQINSKYKFMEANMTQRRQSLESKIPELEKTLETIQFLIDKKDDDKPIETMYELNDTLYAKAKLEKADKANVMLEYSLDEALELLQSKLNTANKGLENANEDISFLRDQITTMEVNTARIYNWDVRQRRAKKVSA
ncbi:hypothetical protein H4219_001102 [Mycoemilia scoparia]|uniref:Prefoldin subunit 3 n=1 Tax=Mycoemilia scoparia TaxID=417184 RepID=A0A9W8A6P6_9FUNG|nr:hypothetical protein H4219_001102 [Mycoemilia scoparia]